LKLKSYCWRGNEGGNAVVLHVPCKRYETKILNHQLKKLVVFYA